MPNDPLTEQEKARIRQEEEFRASVRSELRTKEVQRTRTPYWSGFLLNLIITGLGFFLIGEAGLGVMWLIVAIVLNLSSSFVLFPVIAIGSLIHYRNVYQRKYGPGEKFEWDPLTKGLLFLVVGLVLLAMFMFQNPQ